MDISANISPTTVKFSEATLEQLVNYDNFGLCDGDLIDPPPRPQKNCRFQYRGVYATVCDKKHLHHSQCVEENINQNSEFSCSKCNVPAKIKEPQLKAVR